MSAYSPLLPSRRLRAVLLLLVLAALAGCARPPQLPLRIATNNWVGYAPFYLARQQGQFSEQDVRLVEMVSAADVLHALGNGLVDGAALTLDEAMLLGSKGFDLRIVMILDVSNGADMLISKPDVRALPQLRGRRIGYENTAVGAVLLDAALRAAGLQRQDVTLVPIAANEHEVAFIRNKVDAVVTFEPAASVLREKGGQVLFSSADISGSIVDVLAVRGDIDAEKLAKLKRLMRGWLNAVANLKKKPEAGYEIMGQRYGLSAKEMQLRMSGLLLANMADNHEMMSGNPSKLEVRAKQMAATMKQQRLLLRPPSLQEMIMTEPLNSL